MVSRAATFGHMQWTKLEGEKSKVDEGRCDDRKRQRMIVYKHISPSWTSVLADRLIRYSQFSELNDPFDSLLNTLAYRRAAHERLKSGLNVRLMNLGVEVPDDLADAVACRQIEEWSYSVRAWMDENIVILCLAAKRNNGLMWSHYADAHHGFVVGFDADNPFFQLSKKGYGIRPVVYRNQRPELQPALIARVTTSINCPSYNQH